MGRPRREKTRKAILKAAYKLLKKNGFDYVSMQQITLEAGVSTATLYRWWDNKAGYSAGCLSGVHPQAPAVWEGRQPAGTITEVHPPTR